MATSQRMKTYKSWLNMHARCAGTHESSVFYTSKGITVCARWGSFQNFVDDMGYKPDGMSLDRIDNDGNYEPSNCRWATPRQQAANRSDTLRITYNGETLCMQEWARRIGMSPRGLSRRLCSGISVHEALTMPLAPGKKLVTRAIGDAK